MSAAQEAGRSSSIRILPPDVAARIAAGEVIERPASVVRELLDNAIDAGARRISVEVEEGGIALMRVVDDGKGIEPEQLELAFERHATSKITALRDLGHVATLGFRGEALPSIAAAAEVEVLSRAAGEPVGVWAVLVDGRPVRRAARPAPVGTSLTARGLFERLPARRKFLGSPGAEGRHISTLVAHYALAYPAIAFTLTSNGRRSLVTSGDGDLRNAFAAVYGADNGSEMLDVDHEEEFVRVTGLAGPPSLTRGNRTGISVFVNGRWVQSRALMFAANEAYQSQLPVGRFPIACLAIGVPLDEVDVNVHPAKADVRFKDERAVGRAVRHAVARALEGSRVVGWFPAARADEPVPEAARPTVEGEPFRPAPVAPVLLRPPQPVQSRMEWQPGSVASPPNAPTGTERPLQREVLPLLRVVGQLGNAYVIAEGPDGMYLLDQHAAHERVMYDRIVARREQGEAPTIQPLLDPVLVELAVDHVATLMEHGAHLASIGLEVEAFGERSVLVRAVPAGLAGRDIGEQLAALLEQLHADRRVADPFARAAATVACHSSVRAGMGMALEEMRQLLSDLEASTTPRTCPHGRPTLVHVGTEAIERQFGRR